MSRAALGKLTKVGLGVACALIGAAAFMRAGDSHERTDAKSSTAHTIASGAAPAPRAAEPDGALESGAATSRVAPAPAPGARSRNAPPARVAVAARRSAAPPAPAAEVSVPPRAPERSPTTAAEEPVSVGTRSRPSLQADAPAQSAESAVDARAELEFVARINAAVRAAVPREVLALCAEHERRWPHGMFEQEREGARAIASCSARLPEAVRRARAFLASYPRTAIATRVREECALQLAADAQRKRDP